ncbi:MAG: hypothetical protein A2W38_06375 [Deltaproteobacteria bacterium RBG_19FT_COMBO_58_16]|nr:MAG: hypothetical protein A2W38_06375 [Deltaproteobacteria bacterium RBG_19FT_COMBO_58_16]
MARRFLNILLSAAVLLAAFASGPALAGEPVAVIVHRDNPVDNLSRQEIERIYINNVLSWPDGMAITIYDLATSDPLRYDFSYKVLDRTPARIAEQWAHLKITNQAKNPPLTIKSEALIIRRVSRQKGAIGYVSLGLVKDNKDVKIVHTLR